MNKRKLHHLYTKYAFLKAWYFLIPAVIFGFIAIHGLRNNYSSMVKLREEVYKADQQNGDVEGALQRLRAHVYAHMNTNLSSGSNSIKPPIQLKARYERLVEAEKERTKVANQHLSAEAEQVCGQQFPQAGFNAPRVSCIQEYYAARAVKERPITDDLYKFDFISPRWTPDTAGVSLLLSIIFFVLYITRLATEKYMRRRLS